MDHDLAMMRTPEAWPRWPALPVKRGMKAGAGAPECGLMFADKQPTVYAVGLHSIEARKGETWREVLERYEKKEYASFEALRADGWEVD